jgi:hypothetical protein
MFSPQIVRSEEFLTMPSSSQALYFHLGMCADDDGFVQPKMIMREIGSAEDDLKVLLAKRFLLAFDGGVVVIKHWLIHNLIQKDRYHPTRFQEEKSRLFLKENKIYTDRPPSVNKMLPEVRLGKVRLGEEENTIAEQSSATPFVKGDSFFGKKSKDDGIPMTLAEFILMCRGSRHRFIRLIAEYADDREPSFTTRGQWREFGRRNFRAAQKLAPYTDKQIAQAMEKLENDLKEKGGFISKWTLETLLKYLDEV